MAALPIIERGNLREGEIKLLIEEAADRRDAALDVKLKEHRDELTKKLERTEDVVNSTRDQMADLKGDVGALTAEVSNISGMVKQSLEKGDRWHEADVVFRDGVEVRLSKIELEQATLTKEVRTLRWISTTSNGAGRFIKWCAEKLRDMDFWKIAGLVILYYVCSHYFPALLEYAKHALETFK